MRRILVITTAVVLLLIGGMLGLMATSEVRQTGTTAGIRYAFAHSGFQGYSFVPQPTGFCFEQRSWFGLGRPRLEVAVQNGRLFVDRIDCGPINAGEQLTVTSDSRVLIDDREIRP